jgi:hypothetical protein
VYHLVDSVSEVFSLANKYGLKMWSYNSTYDDVATDPQIWTAEEYFEAWGDAAVDTADTGGLIEKKRSLLIY